MQVKYGEIVRYVAGGIYFLRRVEDQGDTVNLISRKGRSQSHMPIYLCPCRLAFGDGNLAVLRHPALLELKCSPVGVQKKNLT